MRPMSERSGMGSSVTVVLVASLTERAGQLSALGAGEVVGAIIADPSTSRARGEDHTMPSTVVHTCIRVLDPDASIRFYQALGFERRGRLNFASAYNVY